MDCRLVLTALSGTTVNVSLSIAKFDRFEDLEDHVMDYLVSVTDLKVFGCSIDFLHMSTQTYLEDPIWDKLQQSMEYCIIFKDCSEVLPSQELLEGCPIYNIPLAVHVPYELRGSSPRKERLQEYHVCVMSALSQALDSSAQKRGNRADSSASSKCRQQSLAFLTTRLEIASCSTVSLPLVAGSLATKPLRSAVLCNGCMQLKELPTSLVVPPSLGITSFEGCINLAEFTLREIPSPSELPSQTTASDLALGCLSSTGITTLTLTQDFAVIGAHACDNCHLLKKVDLSNTQIEEIQEFTFVHCTSLKEVSLPPTLHTIRVKAFMNCAVLPELAIPPSLKYIASRAFLDCTALRRLVKLPGRHKWRGIHVEEKCLRYMPRNEMAALAAHDPGHGICLWSCLM